MYWIRVYGDDCGSQGCMGGGGGGGIVTSFYLLLFNKLLPNRISYIFNEFTAKVFFSLFRCSKDN